MATHQLLQVVTAIQESSQRPGLMSLAGIRRERICRKELERYFRRLKADVLKLRLHELAASATAELGAHAAEMKLRPVIRRLTPVLLGALAVNLYHAYQEGAKVADRHRRLHFKEADENPPATSGEVVKALGALQPVPGFSDALGVTGQQAADYAATQSATRVVGLDATTLQKLQGVISRGITDELGSAGLGREIRMALDQMTVYRSQMIAVTEMADAFSRSALDSMSSFGVGFKRWVVAPDCCDECLDIDDEVVAVDEQFSAGVMQPPLHPNCRCAIVPARDPDGADVTTAADLVVN